MIEDNTASAAATYTDDSVEPETKYVYRVRAINDHGLSEPSGPVNAQTPAEVRTARQSDPTDATLSSLTVSPVDIDGFVSDRTTGYHVGVAATVAQVTITAVPTNSNAAVTYDPATDDDANADGHQVDLSDGLNTISVMVTAQDGVSTETYTVHVGRGVTDAYGWKAEDDLNTLFAAGNEFPLHIWSDGMTMWVADVTDRKLYAYDLETKARVPGRDFDTLIAAGNENPSGLWSDGETMWVADASDSKLYAYDLETKARVPGRDFDTLLAAGNNDPWGLWSDGVTMWVADTGDSKLYAYDLATRERAPGQDFNTLPDLVDDVIGGIWSDGVTMWVGGQFSQKLYAYDLESKERVSGRDFTTLGAAGNGRPYGIWSDGETMWVADSPDDKLYSYNMPVSDNADLRSITVDGEPVAGFDPAETAYSHRVDETATRFTVAAEARQLLAEVTAITPPDADPNTDGHQVDFPENAREVAVTVTVTAQDGTATKTYTVTVLRGTGPPYGWKAEDDLNTLAAAGNGFPYGLWSDGETMWVVDRDDGQLYAYDVDTGARAPGQDFILDALNGDPLGLWSDGRPCGSPTTTSTMALSIPSCTPTTWGPGRASPVGTSTPWGPPGTSTPPASGPTARPCGSPIRMISSCTPTTWRPRRAFPAGTSTPWGPPGT